MKTSIENLNRAVSLINNAYHVVCSAELTSSAYESKQLAAIITSAIESNVIFAPDSIARALSDIAGKLTSGQQPRFAFDYSESTLKEGEQHYVASFFIGDGENAFTVILPVCEQLDSGEMTVSTRGNLSVTGAQAPDKPNEETIDLLVSLADAFILQKRWYPTFVDSASLESAKNTIKHYQPLLDMAEKALNC